MTVETRMDDALPKVTVLMPVHNGARFLDAALESLGRQSMSSFQVLAVDDGSDDATPAILARASDRDPRVRALRLDARGGIVTALNRGLEVARCELVARMDCDDLSLPSRLDRQVAYLECHPEAVAVGGRILFIDEDGDELGSPEPIMGHEAIDGFHLTGRGGGLCHGAALLRRTALERIGGYREAFSSAEDLDLFLRLAEVGRLANLPETVLEVRLHVRSHSLETRAAQRRQSLEAVREAHRRRGTLFEEATFRFPDPEDDTFGSEEFLARLALAYGRLHAARKHAFRQLLHEPARGRSWRTLAATVRDTVRPPRRPGRT